MIMQAELACSIVGSSIALLSGQKPPFRLLVRAIRGAGGGAAATIRPAVSDDFIVATQRVKTAQKASGWLAFEFAALGVLRWWHALAGVECLRPA